MLYQWIDTMCCAKLTVPPSLAIAKAKQIAVFMNISDNGFKASWQWLKKFRAEWGGS